MPMIDAAGVAPEDNAGPIPPRFVPLHGPVPERRQLRRVGHTRRAQGFDPSATGHPLCLSSDMVSYFACRRFTSLSRS